MQFAQTQIGTPYYMSPELFKNKVRMPPCHARARMQTWWYPAPPRAARRAALSAAVQQQV